MKITRRGFTIRLASLIAAGVAHPALGQDELLLFRSLSARLTGFSEDEIDPELALDMIDGLRAAGLGDALGALLADGGAERATRTSPPQEDGPTEDVELARRIAVAWYSGIHPNAGGESLQTFHDALVWRALEFAKPPGLCSASPTDWSEPPVGYAAAQ